MTASPAFQGDPHGITSKSEPPQQTLPIDSDLPSHTPELLDSVGWEEILGKFGRTMRLAVALTDIRGNLLGPCHNPQPVWSLVRGGLVQSSPSQSNPVCPFCVAPPLPCTAVADALASREVVFVTDQAGLAHVAIPLILRSQPIGALIAGQTFTSYPQPLALQRVARHFGASPQQLWKAAVHQTPLSRATLHLYADLLATSGHAFVSQRYAAILERKLNETNQRYRLMIEGSDDRALFTIDAQGLVTSWNSGAERLLGYSESEIIGQNYSRFFVPEEIQNAVPQRGIQLVQETGWTEEERWQLRKDGTRFLSEIVTTRLSEGNAVEYGKLLHDLTEQRKAAEASLQAQKLESISVLAGGIAHDFNNLLTGILGNISLVMESLPAGDPALPMLATAEQASLQTAELVAKLMAYVGSGDATVARFDLSELVSDLLPLIDGTIPETVQLDLSLPPGLPWINADSREIQQVIMNLVINGAEAFGSEGGIMHVAMGVSGLESASGGSRDGVYFEVRDSGSGMDEVTKSRIFEPFFTTKFTGRGLGLAAVSGIVRRLQGRIDVDSAPGEGSTFRVVFPAVPSELPAINGATKVDRVGDSPGTGLILVVDDEMMVRDLTRAALEQSGYSVLSAENGREGVEVFRQNADTIKAVLLDLTMPVMGGAEALLLMNQIRSDTPIIISTGYAEREVREQCNGALAGVINKPYRMSALCDKIAAVLEERS